MAVPDTGRNIMNYKNFEYVLALAHKPSSSQSISDWKPFGKTTLDDIINHYNEGCVKELKKIPWADNLIEQYGQFLALMNYDLSEVDTIDLASFDKVKFILADLGSISGASDPVEQVKASMNQARGVYYLAQISNKPDTPSQMRRFTPSPVYPSNPEVFDTQDSLEQWLATFYRLYRVAASVAPPPPPPAGQEESGGPDDPSGQGGRGPVNVGESRPDRGSLGSASGTWNHLFMSYQPANVFVAGFDEHRHERSFVDIISEVRDSAIQNEYSEEQTRTLARKAILQESVLGDVRNYIASDLDLLDDKQIALESLRKPIGEITIGDKYSGGKSMINLVAVKLAEPLKTLSKRQSEICSELGLGAKTVSVISPSQHDRIKQMAGWEGTFEASEINVTLPFNAHDLITLK
jgi:hypothetical protein